VLFRSLGDHIFYDNWVTRDLSGSRFWTNVFRWRYEMLSNETESRVRWEKGLPFQVTWCWNGLVVLDSAPFYKGVRFRRNKPDECSSSECSLLGKDFWKLGYGRAVIVPSVKLTYWSQAFEKVHRDLPPFPIKNPQFNEIENTNNDKSWVQAVWLRTDEESRIKWRKGPRNVVCLPLEGVGTHFADEKHQMWEELPNRESVLLG